MRITVQSEEELGWMNDMGGIGDDPGRALKQGQAWILVSKRHNSWILKNKVEEPQFLPGRGPLLVWTTVMVGRFMAGKWHSRKGN
jgi:hypothetical protein